MKLFIDPGHGGTDPGAVGNGLKEKDLTLKISKKIKSLLEKDYQEVQIKMSRETDKSLSLSQRTSMANAWGADYLISIHINAGGGTGYESFIYNGRVSSKTTQAQNTIHAAVMNAIKKHGIRDRGKKKANFHMCRESKMPALLVENLFIDTKADADKLKDSKFIDDLAKGYVEGIAKAFSLKKKSKTPSSAAPKNSSGTVHRVIVDGKQVGAYSVNTNTMNEVKKHLGKARMIRIEKV